MKIFTGKVIAKRNDKTATVLVERILVHPVYKKRFRRTKKYLVHDEIGAKEKDRIKFVAAKPVSKLKKWRIVEVISNKKEK